MADSNNSSMIVAIVAIIVIIALGFFAMQAFGPGADTNNGGTTGTLDVNVGTDGGNE
jgi:hypothetical protein